MSTYIVLRNNKESGPLSLDEIKSFGLREQDLVWIEGQSVCWVSPAEIKSLKPFVGNAEVKSENLQKSQPVKQQVNDQYSAYQPQTVIESDTDTAVETIPEKKKNTKPKTPVKKTNPEKVFNQAKSTQPLQEEIETENKYAKKEEPVALETLYERPWAEIKAMYVKEAGQKKKKTSFRIKIPPAVKQVAIYAGILLSGLALGLIFKGGGKKKQAIASRKSIQVPVIIPVDTVIPASQENDKSSNDEEVAALNHKKSITISDAYEGNSGEEYNEAPKKTATHDNTPVRNNQADNEEQPVEKKEIKAVNKEVYSQVSVKTNDYIVASFGGIRNLELTFNNESDHALEKVLVELQYLKPRDELLKTETIEFNLVPAHGEQTIPVKRSNRGVKVNCRIIRIQTKDAG